MNTIFGGRLSLSVPSLKDVLGFDFGEKIMGYEEVIKYTNVLVSSCPDKIERHEYAVSWENRSLSYFVISDRAEVGREKPAVWMSACVHGNEPSGTDALVCLMYLLLAADSCFLTDILENVVVIIDPLQNPDGRTRYLDAFRKNSGLVPDAFCEAAEHVQEWPTGRFNHYLFDLNRDWIFGTQPETCGRVEALLLRKPAVLVDIHEVGQANFGYFFPPYTLPINPFVTSNQKLIHESIGECLSSWCDRYEIEYLTGEKFDLWSPLQSDGWYAMHGGIGLTFESNSVFGCVTTTASGKTVTYLETLSKHLICSAGLLDFVARNVCLFSRQTSEPPVSKKCFIFPPAERSNVLIDLLLRQHVEVFVSLGESVLMDGSMLKNGCFVVFAGQPKHNVVSALLTTRSTAESARGCAFELPLLLNVDCCVAEINHDEKAALLKDFTEPRLFEHVSHFSPNAFVVCFSWSHTGVVFACSLMSRGVKLRVHEGAFRAGNTDFNAGTCVVLKRESEGVLEEKEFVVMAEKSRILIRTLNSSWLQEGRSISCSHLIKNPRVALLWGEPLVPESVGRTWHLFEQNLSLKFSRINVRHIRYCDLSSFTALVMPDFYYPDRKKDFEEALGDGWSRIQVWIESGGTLITFCAGTAWLSDIGMFGSDQCNQLSVRAEQKPLLLARIEESHWLATGVHSPAVNVLGLPDKLLPCSGNKGVDIGVFAPASEVRVSGALAELDAQLIGGTVWLKCIRMRKGHIVAFATDPLTNIFFSLTELIFLNALLLAH